MISQFLLANLHFAISFLVALVIFAIWWLYYDAWREQRPRQELPRLLGFLLIAGSYVFQASMLESATVETALQSGEVTSWLLVITRLAGYGFLLWGIQADPLQKRPTYKTAKRTKSKQRAPLKKRSHAIFGAGAPLGFAFPLMSGAVAWLYWRRSTRGLERHLKPIGAGFLVIALADLIALSSLLRDTTNVTIHRLVSPFGVMWMLEHLALLIAALILGRWVWRYLLKRFDSQIFIIFTTTVLTVFVITTTAFTGLLLRNLQAEALAWLDTDVRVLNYTLDSLKTATLSDAEVVAQNQQVQAAVVAEDFDELADIAQSLLLTKQRRFLVITGDDGRVLARGEDTERIGGSLSDDPTVKRALANEATSSIVVQEGPLNSRVTVQSATPIVHAGRTVGTVLTGTVIDNAFVDGLKRATGLEAAVYGHNVLSATTLLAADNRSRWVGVTEEDPTVIEEVLQKGSSYSGSVQLLNTPYFAAYLPLKDLTGQTVGMLFVGRPQITVLRTASRSVELTFLVAALLMVLSIIPSCLIARYISYQVR